MINSPGSVFAFSEHLIDAAFTEGRNISELSVCLDVVQQSGLNRDDVSAILQTQELATLTEDSFEFAQTVQTGFPSLFLRSDRGLVHLGGAQLDVATVKAAVDAQLNE